MMLTSEINEKARREQIKNMLKLPSENLRIKALSENTYLCNAFITIIYEDEGKLYYGNEAEFKTILPPGFPLMAKPIVYFENNKKRPVNPHISSEGYGCFGKWTTHSTLNNMFRKILLASILDENAIDVKDAYPKPLALYNELLKNPNISFPLMSPKIVYQWIPLLGVEAKFENQTIKRSPKLKG